MGSFMRNVEASEHFKNMLKREPLVKSVHFDELKSDLCSRIKASSSENLHSHKSTPVRNMLLVPETKEETSVSTRTTNKDQSSIIEN